MRFAHENDYDLIVAEAGNAWDVETSLIKALIGAESEFNPNAYRAEPQIADASYGLMQLLYGTARTMGFTGAALALYDPVTNVRLGTRFISDKIRTASARGYGVDSAISAYNAGFSTVRAGDGKRVTNVPGAPFINQAYVNRVLELASYFRHGAPPQLETVTVYARPMENFSMWAGIAFAALLLLILNSKRFG